MKDTPNIVSVGSVSFWLQDQTYWGRAARQSQSLAQSDALITQMGSAMTNLSNGLASIANQTALNRVNSQLSAAVQSILQGNGSGSTSSTSSSAASSSDSNSTGSSSTSASPATGTGTAPVSVSASLSSLGILDNGTINVSDGTNTTTYTSTGNDTVANLINAINANAAGNANVTAGLNNRGELVITSKNTTDTVTIGGIYASNIGFGTGNATFQPTSS